MLSKKTEIYRSIEGCKNVEGVAEFNDYDVLNYKVLFVTY